MRNFARQGGEVKEPFDINEALKSTIEVTRNAWKSIAEVLVDYDPDLPSVMCVEGSIKQAFLNVIMNAIHAIEARTENDHTYRGQITVRTQRTRMRACVSVQDTGIGILSDIQDKIFDPFFTTKPIGKGMGQGLTIAYSAIVESHGGTIELDSAEGEGTLNTICLPIQDKS